MKHVFGSAGRIALVAATVWLATACDSQDPAPDAAAPVVPTEAADVAAPPEEPIPTPTGEAGMAASDAGATSLLREVGANVESIAERLARQRYRELLAIDHLVSRGEVREVTGYTGTLTRMQLEGQSPDANYNAFRLAADDAYGFGLQVWKFRSDDQAANYFARLQETYVVTGGVQVGGEATGFLAELGGIRQVVFVATGQSSVVAVSCDERVCPVEDPLLNLAERVYNRL